MRWAASACALGAVAAVARRPTTMAGSQAGEGLMIGIGVCFFIYNCRVYSINTNVYVDLDSDYRSRDSYEDESQYDGEREDSDNESPHAPRLVVFPF